MAKARFRVGVQARPQHTTYASMREAWQRVEAIGVDTLWTWDHFFPVSGDPKGSHFECWTLLASMAEVTKRVEFGALVSAIGYRNPALLSNMAKTIDHMSGGRFVLGLGAGWKVEDFREFGYHMATPPERLRELRQGIETILQRWSVDVPPPVHNPIPIMIGGGGEKVTLRLTARYAQMWNGVLRPDVLAQKNRILDEHCRALGRDPAEIERSVSIEREDAHDDAALDAFKAAGATHLILRFQDPWDFTAVERLVAWRDRQ
jgi:probable F420-dependent oxidoreductase